MKANRKPYYYMLFTAPLAWFLSLFLGNNGYEGFLVIAFIIYGVIGTIFGYHWSRNAWQWGVLVSIPNWLFDLSLKWTTIDIIKEQRGIGILLILHPLIAGCFGAYIGVGVRILNKRED